MGIVLQLGAATEPSWIAHFRALRKTVGTKLQKKVTSLHTEIENPLSWNSALQYGQTPESSLLRPSLYDSATILILTGPHGAEILYGFFRRHLQHSTDWHLLRICYGCLSLIKL
jgi:hypothetical protein